MEVSIFVHGEEIAEGTFAGFDDGVFDGMEFVDNELAIGLRVVEGCENIDGFVFLALEDKPPGAFGEFEDE
jgi:hypothetical protein